MSPSDALQDAVQIFLLGVAIYIIYRALSLRRALVDHPYRTRALWTAIGGLTIISFFFAGYLDSIFGETPSTITGVVVEGVIWGFTFLVLYGWIANNIYVALSSDFFHRDALYWKKGGGVVALVAILLSYVFASLPPWWYTSTESAVTNVAISVIFAAVALYATVVLAILYRRIADRRIKTYTRWVVLSVASILLLIILPTGVGFIAAIVWIYCVYRSVGSLAIRTQVLPS